MQIVQEIGRLFASWLPTDMVGLVLFSIIIVLVVMVPFFIARARMHPHAIAIGVLCLLLGWTFFGWAVALVWSLAGGRPNAEQLGDVSSPQA